MSHEYLFWSYGAKKAVRKGNWKAVISGKDKSLELYDLANDIGEENDVANRHPGLVAEMLQIIETATTNR